MKDLPEFVGDELIERTLALVARFRPLHVSFVGGEPLVRHRELTRLIPKLNNLGIEVQVVTSAVRQIPAEWTEFPNLHLAVSVDGLKNDHDARRAPATYERILRHMTGHRVIIHCTIIPRFLASGYLEEFVHFWSDQKSVRKILFSLFTPQRGVQIPERLTRAERGIAVDRIHSLRSKYTKVHAPDLVLEGFRHPPASPRDCIFTQVTTCISPDLATQIAPCQIGGRPECSECGCLAGAWLASVGRIKLAGLIKLSDIFAVSKKLGDCFRNGHNLRSRLPANPGLRTQ